MKLKTIFFVFAMAMVIYMIMMFYTIPTISNNGAITIFDLHSLGYSYDEAIQILNSLSSSQISMYKYVQIPLDFIYPTLIGLFGFMLLMYLSKYVRVLKYLAFIPILITIADLTENVFFFQFLSGNISETSVIIASVFTTIKSISTMVFYSVVVLALLLIVLRKKVFYAKQ